MIKRKENRDIDATRRSVRRHTNLDKLKVVKNIDHAKADDYIDGTGILVVHNFRQNSLPMDKKVAREFLTGSLYNAVRKKLNLSGEDWKDMVTVMNKHPMIKLMTGTI